MKMIFKIFKYIILLILAFILLLVIINIPDEELNPELAKLVNNAISLKSSDTDNLLLHLVLLHAPEAMDAKSFLKEKDMAEVRAKKYYDKNPEKYLNLAESLFGGQEKKREIPSFTDLEPLSLEIGKLSNYALNYYDYTDPFYINYSDAKVFTKEEREFPKNFHNILENKTNQILLKRYKELYNYPKYVDLPLISEKSNRIFMTSLSVVNELQRLSRIVNAEAFYLYNNGYKKKAFKQMITNYNYWKKILITGKHSWYSYLGTLVIHSNNHRALTSLFLMNPELVKQYYSEFESAFELIDIGSIDIKYMVEDDFRYINYMPSKSEECVLHKQVVNKYICYFVHKFLYKENSSFNASYHFAKNMLNLNKLSPKELMEKEIEFENSNNLKMELSLLYNPLGKAMNFLDRIDKSTFILILHGKNEHLKMSKILLDAIVKNIPIDGMKSYIASQPKELQNSITESPFEWDKKSKCIYYYDIKHATIAHPICLYNQD